MAANSNSLFNKSMISTNSQADRITKLSERLLTIQSSIETEKVNL
jgi:hypothetical protein